MQFLNIKLNVTSKFKIIPNIFLQIHMKTKLKISSKVNFWFISLKIKKTKRTTLHLFKLRIQVEKHCEAGLLAVGYTLTF